MPTPAAEIPPCTMMLLHRLSRRAARLYDHQLAPSGLGIRQFGLLNAVWSRDGASVTELAAHLDLDRTTLTRNLRPLLRAGLLRLDPGADARSRALRITQKGQDRVRSARKLWRAAEDGLAEKLGPERTAVLRDALAFALARLPAH